MRSKIKFIPFIPKFAIAMLLIFIFTHVTAGTAFAFLPFGREAQEIFHRYVPSPPAEETGQELTQRLVFSGLRYAKMIVAVVGILFISLMGYTLVVKGENEEDVTKAKTGLIYAVVAFVLISASQELGRIFDMRETTVIGSPQDILGRVRLFDRQVEIFMVFVKYVIGAFATLMIIKSASKMITGGANEEETSKSKKSIMFSAAGLLLIYVGDIFINRVFYTVDRSIYSGITGVHPQVDARAGVEQIVGITNLIVSFVGPVAVLVLLAGAILYIVSKGEEEQMNKAKRMVFAAAVGIVMIYGAFAIVNVVVSGRLDAMGALPQ